jgi:drug/metabolite transporter (DMT)-like permease
MLLLALTSMVWGAAWPVMKTVISDVPVLTFRFVTAWGSGGLILAIVWLTGSSVRIKRRDIGPAMLAATFSISGWFYLSALALTWMPAGRASVLAYTMPLWAFVFAVMLTGERITANRILGLSFGMGTVLLLAADDLSRFGGVPLGVMATLTAAASWGLGTVIQKKITWHTPLFALAGWQLVFGGIPLAVAALVFDDAPFDAITLRSIAAMAYVIVVATVIGYWAWFRVIRMVSSSTAALGILPSPLIGVISSALLLGEPLGWHEFAAVALLTASLATMLPRRPRRAKG